MTAHSLIGEKEKCLQVGMNDYLSKPFKAPDLLYKISQHTHFASKDQLTIAEKENIETPVTELPNLSTLKDISGGDKTFEKELIELFIINVPKDINNIQEALLQNDESKMKQLCHKLKSSVLIFG